MRSIDTNEEVKRQLNYLAAVPSGSCTMSREDAKAMLLDTGGNMLACGRLYNFDVKNIGAGVCRVTLTPTNI